MSGNSISSEASKVDIFTGKQESTEKQTAPLSETKDTGNGGEPITYSVPKVLRVKADLAEPQSIIDELVDKLRRSKDDNRKLRIEIKEVKSLTGESANLDKDTPSDVETLQSEFKRLKNKVINLQANVSQLTDEKDSLVKSLAEAKSNYDAAESKAVEYHNALKEKEEKIGRLEVELGGLDNVNANSEEVTKLEQKVSSLTVELEMLKIGKDLPVKNSEDLVPKSEYEDLELKYTDTKTELEQIKGVYYSHKDDTSVKVSGLQEDLKSLTTINTNIMKELVTLVESEKSLQAKITQLELQAGELQNQDGNIAEVEMLQNNLNSLTEELNNVRVEFSKKESEYELSIKERDSDIEKLRYIKNDLTQRLFSIEGELNKLKGQDPQKLMYRAKLCDIIDIINDAQAKALATNKEAEDYALSLLAKPETNSKLTALTKELDSL